MGIDGRSATRPEGREPAPDDADTQAAPSSRASCFILYAVLAGFLLQVSVNTYASGVRPIRVIMCVLCFSALCVLQVLHARPRSDARGHRYRAATLSAQVLLTYLPLHWLGNTWDTAGGFLAASVLLLLPARLKGPVFLVVVAANAVVAGLRHEGTPFVVSTASSTLVTGLVIYAISRMAWLLSELRRARTKMVGAISQERLRFARDLHDLLGYSLSAITLKTEVAMRHVPPRHEQVKEELTSILAISRQALTDVRHVAHSYQTLSLASDLETCVAMLVSASIEVDVRTSVPLPADRTGTVLAVVLREAVTNMLRHSKVRHCAIGLDRAGRRLRLSIVNDGTALESRADGRVPSATSWPEGSGLVNLETRLTAVGGTLTAGLRADGRFEVVAEVPDGHGTPTAETAAGSDDGGGEGHRGGRRPVGRPGRDGARSTNEANGCCERRPQLKTEPNRMLGGMAARRDHVGRRGHASSTPLQRKLSAES
ncbi:sensor histidine kinase [Streptomyces rubradiris]|uniref:sensor histidine kinase n=1 Tax=Streptomyces rubradiris TaxID=285531 RepID=UPI0036EE8085